MKKPIDFENWKKRIIELMPGREAIFAIVGLIIYALFEDLRLCFGINLVNLKQVTSTLTMFSFGWVLCWTIEALIYIILKRRKDKKQNENQSKGN